MITMKRIYIFLFSVIGTLNLVAQSPAQSTEAYKTGEEIKFSLSYGWVTAGYVTFTVKDTVVRNINTKQVTMTGKTAGMLDALYKIRDQYTSFINPNSNQPVKSIRDIREGKYRYFNEVTYDYSTQYEDSITISSKKSGEHKVPYAIQDILSALYYGRKFAFNDDMSPGDIITFETYFSDEIYPLRIKFVGIETIKTEKGKIECFLFHPVTEVGRAFKTEEDMKLWVSRDKNRIPVAAKMNLKIGSFDLNLVDYKNLSNPFSSKK